MYGKVLLVLIDIFRVFYKVIISFIDEKKKKSNFSGNISTTIHCCPQSNLQMWWLVREKHVNEGCEQTKSPHLKTTLGAPLYSVSGLQGEYQHDPQYWESRARRKVYEIYMGCNQHHQHPIPCNQQYKNTLDVLKILKTWAFYELLFLFSVIQLFLMMAAYSNQLHVILGELRGLT